MAEYKLSYTAAEIDEKLGMVDNMVKSVNGQMPDENGNVEIPTNGSASEVVIDPTLSQAGQAADAKAVGDAFAQATAQIEGALEGLAATIPAVDSELSDTSENPVQNKVIYGILNELVQSIMPMLLPDVTEGDNGKFLQVVGGAWSAVLLTDVSEVGM